MCGFYCNAFIEYMLAGKTLLDYTQLFSQNDYKKNDKIIHKYFKDKYGQSRIQTEKIDETRNYLLDEIKHDDLMREKHKKTRKNLSYAEHLLILASTVTGCVSVSTFASLFDLPVGITSSAVEIKNFCNHCRN